MSAHNQNRHKSGAVVAGRPAGGEFAATHRTAPSPPPATDPLQGNTPEFTREAKDLEEGDFVDLAEVWTREYEEETGTSFGADHEYFEVEEVHDIGDGHVEIALINAPANARVPANQVLPIADPYADIREDYWDQGTVELPRARDWDTIDFSPHELGIEHLGGVYHVDVIRDGDGDAWITANLHEDPVQAGGLTEEEFNRGYAHVEHVFAKRYGADGIQNLDGTGLDFSVVAKLDDGGTGVTSAGMVGDILHERTALAKFHNETDAGTWNSPYVYRELHNEIQAGYFPEDRNEMQAAAREALKSSGTATDHTTPQLAMLSNRGYCTDAEKALAEIGGDQNSSDSSLVVALRTSLQEELKQQAERGKR